MNKKSIVFIVMLALMSFSAKAQWFDFSNNQRASIGINLGVVGYDFSPQGGLDKNIANFGMGANISIMGLYLDFIYQDPSHRWDKIITLEEYPDQTALTINVGYQIPVLSWLYLTPVIGYSNETWGRTLGNSIEVQPESYSIYHKYVQDDINNHFNYGMGLMLRPVEFVEIGAMATSHAIYGTLSLSTNGKKK